MHTSMHGKGPDGCVRATPWAESGRTFARSGGAGAAGQPDAATESGLTITCGSGPDDRVPLGGEGVVQPEGAATRAGASVPEAAITVWAFGPDQDPREVALTDAPPPCRGS